MLATRASLSAAVAAWPCSAGPWEGVRPRYYRALSDAGSDEQRELWIETLLSLPEAERPSLVMAWTSGADAEGHAEGPEGEKVHRAMGAADRLLGRLLDFLSGEGRASRTTLLLASDHGMAPVTRVLDLLPLVPKSGYYPFVAVSGPVCNVYCKGAAQEGAVAKGLAAAAPGVQLWRRGRLPDRLRYAGQRTGDLVLLAPPGVTFASFARWSRGEDRPAPRGMHGYDPETCPDMAGIFYAWGAGVARGRSLGEARTVDVAPTVCALLGLAPPPHAEGRALALR